MTVEAPGGQLIVPWLRCPDLPLHLLDRFRSFSRPLDVLLFLPQCLYEHFPVIIAHIKLKGVLLIESGDPLTVCLDLVRNTDALWIVVPLELLPNLVYFVEPFLMGFVSSRGQVSISQFVWTLPEGARLPIDWVSKGDTTMIRGRIGLRTSYGSKLRSWLLIPALGTRSSSRGACIKWFHRWSSFKDRSVDIFLLGLSINASTSLLYRR